MNFGGFLFIMYIEDILLVKSLSKSKHAQSNQRINYPLNYF